MRTALIVTAAIALAAPALAQGVPSSAAKTPESALDAPAHLGFEVLESRRGVDGAGWPTSTTLVKATLDEVYARFSDLFAKDAEFAPGWKIAGAGRSDQHGFVSATIQGPTGQQFTCKGIRREETVTQLELTAKPRHSSGGRMTPRPAGDRIPPASPVAK